MHYPAVFVQLRMSLESPCIMSFVKLDPGILTVSRETTVFLMKFVPAICSLEVSMNGSGKKA